MITKRQNNNLNVFIQENDLEMDAYPVDLSLFLNTSQMHSDPAGNSHHWLPERNDPVAIAQSALIVWNSYIERKEEHLREHFLKAAFWLVEDALCVGGNAMGWPIRYAHPHYFTIGSWLSSVAQGCGLSVLTRAYQLTREKLFLETAHHVARTFERDILDGGICAPIGPDGVFFEEVAVYPAAHTLHGYIFALLGLYDYATVTENPHIIQPYIEQCEATLHNIFDEFDLGFWTRADLLGANLATPIQMAQQIALIKALALYRKCPLCTERAERWQKYRKGTFSRLRYIAVSHKVLFQKALLQCLRAIIIPQSPKTNLPSATHLRVCVAMPNHLSPGGIGTFVDRMARVMADRWHIEYVAHRIETNVGERVMHQFGKKWMSPWLFPQVWLYVLAGAHKIFLLIHQGANYDLIIAQDGVFSGAFATFVGKLTGVRVVCFDHSTLTYKSKSYHTEKQSYLNARAWPWLFLQLVRFLLTFYWPSLDILARFATSQTNHLLSPGVFGDEIDEICHKLLIPPSRVTRFNLSVDTHYHRVLSIEEKGSQRARMGIPTDALVIAITVRFDLEKGLDISMESISRTLTSLSSELRDQVRVIIAGDGPLREWLEEEIRHRGLSHLCQILGNISNGEVNALLAISDISLHTSTRGVCMPTAVLEGMAAGCAVIASNEPLANVHVLAEERGIVVPGGDVEQTSRALDRLLKDSNLRDRMGKAAREYIALHHSAEAFRRTLLRMSYWSDLDQLLETRAKEEKSNERVERE